MRNLLRGLLFLPAVWCFCIQATDWTHHQLPDETLYLLDGTAMMHRAFHGKGSGSYLAADGATEVAALKAMGIELAQFIAEVKPRYLAMAFDTDRNTTFRRVIMPSYKAQRPALPLDLELQLPLASKMASALGVKCYCMKGWEADDIMATLARWAREVHLNAVLVSDDKDMHQVIRDRVHVMTPKSRGHKLLGQAEVMQKYGLGPSVLTDLTGLTGDHADNIPGIKGIGAKAGYALIERFGTLDAVFKSLDQVGEMKIRGAKGIQQRLSEEGAYELASLCKTVATLSDEVPLEGLDRLKSSDLLYKGAAREAEGVLRALGFLAPLRLIQQQYT
ncbi:unnamed protein product [Chrysoparadoxa australica]